MKSKPKTYEEFRERLTDILQDEFGLLIYKSTVDRIMDLFLEPVKIKKVIRRSE